MGATTPLIQCAHCYSATNPITVKKSSQTKELRLLKVKYSVSTLVVYSSK